jgi:alpha-L-fucosidase
MEHNYYSRRRFISSAVAGTLGIAATGFLASAKTERNEVPKYLRGFDNIYKRDPHAAALAWFRDAKFGLFMHYGLYSILGRGEWAMQKEAIPIAAYEKLKEQFRPDKFDADFITDLAWEAGMRYVNITSRHHDSFCLFDSKYSDYNSMNSPARRDLVAELSEQCNKKGLGLFLYYSYALDWRHPSFYSREFYKYARPDYKTTESRYIWKNDDDFRQYISFVHSQITELLTNYGPIAGMWFDPIEGYYARPDLFPIHETYALINRLQPQTLISFKYGATGTEDFAAPERKVGSMEETIRKTYGDKNAIIAHNAWESNKTKWGEICDTLQPESWGYRKLDEGKHLDAEETYHRLATAFGQHCNLLMNTGPLPDGSIHPVDVKTLREVGKRIKKYGWPAPVAPASANRSSSNE